MTSLVNGTQLSLNLTDKIKSFGVEYSIALCVLDPIDGVSFYSKEKEMIDSGFSPQMKMWPNLSFK